MTAEQPAPHIPDVPPHGTLRGYSLGCRCLFCKSAKTATTEADSDAGTPEKGVPGDPGKPSRAPTAEPPAVCSPCQLHPKFRRWWW
jgi:hypothetical protein